MFAYLNLCLDFIYIYIVSVYYQIIVITKAQSCQRRRTTLMEEQDKKLNRLVVYFKRVVNNFHYNFQHPGHSYDFKCIKYNHEEDIIMQKWGT